MKGLMVRKCVSKKYTKVSIPQGNDPGRTHEQQKENKVI
jgi:hypothetical protein